MLLAGGASVNVAGFRRTQGPVMDIAGLEPIDLGVTHDGAFVHRLAKVAMHVGGVPWPSGRAGPRLVIARSLEMLALANRVRSAGERPAIVYESLDIHRLLLRTDLIGRSLRAAERWLLRRVSLIITSSPAFVREYFEAVQTVRQPILLLENKVLAIGAPVTRATAAPPKPQRPLVIGWFGALRCRKSLELLATATRAMSGAVEVVLRGRPAHREFEDFEGFVAAEPYMTFEGPYRSPEDLANIYGQVDFVWTIDFFEEGQNSLWLLPNRLYEGCRNGCIPIAMAQTETARFLNEKDIGLTLTIATPQALVDLLGSLNGTRVDALANAVASCDTSIFVADERDCLALVGKLETVVFPRNLSQPKPERSVIR